MTEHLKPKHARLSIVPSILADLMGVGGFLEIVAASSRPHVDLIDMVVKSADGAPPLPADVVHVEWSKDLPEPEWIIGASLSIPFRWTRNHPMLSHMRLIRDALEDAARAIRTHSVRLFSGDPTIDRDPHWYCSVCMREADIADDIEHQPSCSIASLLRRLERAIHAARTV